MKRKPSRPKRRKPAKPLFYVDNPNMSELKWLDNHRSTNRSKDVLSDAIPEAPGESVLEQSVPTRAPADERKQVTINAVAVKPGASLSAPVMPAPVIPAVEEVEAGVDVPGLTSGVNPAIQQYGLQPFSFKNSDHIDVTIPFKEPFSDTDYALVASVNLPFCYTVIHTKTAESASLSIIRSPKASGATGCLNWIAFGS